MVKSNRKREKKKREIRFVLLISCPYLGVWQAFSQCVTECPECQPGPIVVTQQGRKTRHVRAVTGRGAWYNFHCKNQANTCFAHLVRRRCFNPKSTAKLFGLAPVQIQSLGPGLGHSRTQQVFIFVCPSQQPNIAATTIQYNLHNIQI